MENTNEILNKIAELSIVNTKEINKLKSKDEEIITSVGTLNDLTNIIIQFSNTATKDINEVRKQNTELKLEFDEYKHQQEKEKEVAINAIRLSQGLDGYCNQKDFGNRYKFKIGSKSVGKLLRVCEIAMKSRTSSTIPYDNLCPTYAKPTTFKSPQGYEVQTFKWNYEKCVKKIDKWLNEHDLLDQIYSLSTPAEAEKFIANLHKTYIE